jgi:diacylglycerol kinase (ATP)
MGNLIPGKLLELQGAQPEAAALTCSGVAGSVTSLQSVALSLPPHLEQQLDPPQKERLGAALAEMDRQLGKLADTPWLCQPTEPGEEEVCGAGIGCGTPWALGLRWLQH